MKKKIIVLVIALCLCIGILASCGKGNTSADKAKVEVLNDFQVFGNEGDYTKDNYAYTTATEFTLGEGVELTGGWLANIYRFPIQRVRKLVDGIYKYGVFSYKTTSLVINTEYDNVTIEDGFIITTKIENAGLENETITYTLYDRNFSKVLESVDKVIDIDVYYFKGVEYLNVRIEGETKFTEYEINAKDNTLKTPTTTHEAPQTGDVIGAQGTNLDITYMDLEMWFGKDYAGYVASTVGNTMSIYKNGKLVGTLDLSSYNVTFESPVGDKLIIQTTDAVDRSAKYSYSDGDTRFLVRTYVVDVKAAKISEVNTTAVFTGEFDTIVSADGSKNVAKLVTAQKIDNYILQPENTYIIASDASITSEAFSQIDFNEAVHKLKDNRYLVVKANRFGMPEEESMLIVDSKLNIVSNLSGLEVVNVMGEYITLDIGTAQILVNADGKVVIGEDKGYTRIGSVLNGKVVVAKPNETNPLENDYSIVDVATGNAVAISYDKDNEELNVDFVGIGSFFYSITRDNTETAGPADGVTDIYTILNGGTKLGTLEAGEWLNDFTFTHDFAVILTSNNRFFKLTVAA